MSEGLKRILVILLSVLIQISLVYTFFILFPKIKEFALLVFYIIAFLILFSISSVNTNPDYKLTWMVVIILVPVVGTLLYILSKKKVFKDYELNIRKNKAAISALDDDYSSLTDINDSLKKQVLYLKNHANSTFFTSNDTKYYPVGEKMWEDLLVELEKAREFIFMEYFTIEDGQMLGAIAEILKRKSDEGVDVRFITDALGSILKLSKKIKNEFKEHGIKFILYNSEISILSLGFNNRDHRKITVIDGKVGFTGGINLADEYINKTAPFGHWKDTGIRIKGSAVNYFTIMFLTLWGIASGEEINYEQFLNKNPKKYDNESFIAPYTDYPGDGEDVGSTMYENIISSGEKYVYIISPYLILDYSMLKILSNASKSGVDIRIILPGIPDKKIPYLLAKSFYKILLKSGIRIFEYTPGFVHCKQFVSDDKHAVIGTINMDYRSLTHNLENAVYLINDKLVHELKEDFLLTQDKCQEIYLENLKRNNIIDVILISISRIFAPLL